jgi:hypothetical protein
MSSMLSPDFATGGGGTSGLSGTIDRAIGTYPVGTNVELTMTGEYIYSDHIGTTQQGVCSRMFELYVRTAWGELNRFYLGCNVGPHATTMTMRTQVSGTIILRQLGYQEVIVDGPWSMTIRSSLSLRRITGPTAAIGFYKPGFSYPVAADSVTARDLPWSVELHFVAVPYQSAGLYADKTSWRFVPDDGSPEQRACDAAYGIDTCWREKFFDRSGMVYASGIVNGEYFEAKPIRVVVPPPVTADSVAVTCGPVPQVRGQDVRCTVSGLAIVGRWTFTPDDTSLLAITKDVNGTNKEWYGPLVTDGTVSADGWVKTSDYKPSNPVAGRASARIAQVSVTARDWGNDTTAWTITPIATRFSDPPANEHELGLNSMTYGMRAEGMATVDSGPNTGLAYFTSLPFTLLFDVQYNSHAMKEGSAFHRMQPLQETVLNGVRYCARSRVVDDIPLVQKHEGFSMKDVNSHTEVYARYFLHDVRPKAEKVVARGAEELQVASIGRDAHAIAADSAEAITHRVATNPYRSSCVFNYNPTVTFP